MVTVVGTKGQVRYGIGECKGIKDDVIDASRLWPLQSSLGEGKGR